MEQCGDIEMANYVGRMGGRVGFTKIMNWVGYEPANLLSDGGLEWDKVR